jgi:CBS domain-containing protein
MVRRNGAPTVVGGTITTVEVLEWMRSADVGELLDGYAGRLTGAAEAELQRDGIETGRAIATLNDMLTRRLLATAEQQMGPPPCPYTWMALGSQGRREQSLLTDQDHALAYAEDSADARKYFSQLAKQVTHGLRRAGIPYCPGGYMATNWRRPLPAWENIFRNWLDRPSSRGVVEAEVFLDYRSIHGELDLQPIDAILRTAADRPRFLILMARAAVTFRPPLRFGRIYRRQVDLKTAGLAAIVLLARLYALAGGSGAKSTVERLQAGARAGQVSEHGAEKLGEAYEDLSRLRLESQLRAVRTGQPAANTVRTTELTSDQRHRLTQALHVVRDHQQHTEFRFHTETVS